MSLTPPQAAILERGLIDSGFSCVLQMPTGSGKTWLAEQSIAQVLGRGRRAIYLTPLRALATELMDRWRDRFDPSPVGVFTGEYGTSKRPYPVSYYDARLLVMTPERLDACTRSWRSHWGWIPEVDLLVVDEIHLLGDRQRGARLEGAISRFQRLNPFVQVLGLSATLGNRVELASWLQGVEFTSDWRPIPIDWRIVRFRKADEKPELLWAEVCRCVEQGGKSLVFVQSRRRAEGLSRFLAEKGLRARHHHAGLNHASRKEIEDGFRRGTLDVLVATSTLEMGLNLPVRQVVLYDVQFFDGGEFRPLPTNQVWQRVGRAGRPGLDPSGEAVLLTPTWDRAADGYSRGIFEPVRSGLCQPRYLAEQILAELSSGLSRTAGQLSRTFGQSLAAHQDRLPDLNKLLWQMQEADLVRDDTDREPGSGEIRLLPTRLGRIAARHLLEPATVQLFQAALEDEPAASFLDLLLIAASSSDCEPVLPVDFEELDDLADALARENSQFLGKARSDLEQRLGVRGKRLLAALKMASVGRAWTRTGDAEQVAELSGCYPFEILRLKESLERLLTAMADIQRIEKTEDDQNSPSIEQEVSLAEKIHALQRMVQAGLDEEVITLTLIPGLGPAWARRLKLAEITDLESLAQAEPETLAAMPGMSLRRARKWTEAAVDLVRTRSAYWYRESRASAPTFPEAPEWKSHGIDPYRLRRSLDLKLRPAGEGTYHVWGGLEPHVVRQQGSDWVCDCPDARKGQTCKHVLAVRLARGDRSLYAAVNTTENDRSSGPINLRDLWFEAPSPGGRSQEPWNRPHEI
ncbi:helicase [Singulisphaera sp. GP187]|uniref:DEAD/DEAH box helicase n=1 Tax=Singulisphaera sp. GP187 TaxID=1882752 RepID=UPI000929FE72|nr:DEAD/DEAH box helicase [Singulisphaera sp. GP187]SIO63309.1 helicase [Singulisphaera sp. GP187]